MNTETMKAQLIDAGAIKEEIAKVDFNKIGIIVEHAEKPDEVCKAMKAAYPNFNEEEFKKALAVLSEGSDETMELSEDELESVAGGSVGSWVKNNKELVIGLSIVGLGIVSIPAFTKFGKSLGAGKVKQAYDAGYMDGTAKGQANADMFDALLKKK